MRVVKSPRLDEEEKTAKELLESKRKLLESDMSEQDVPINGRSKRSLRELLSLLELSKRQIKNGEDQ